MEEREKRKKQIIFMIKLYFEKVKYLENEDIEEWTGKALDAFLDSDLSIDEINEQIAKTFKNKEEGFSMKTNNTKEKYMRFMFVDDDKNTDLETPKQLIKKNKDDNEAGFANSIILTTLSLITFSLCALGLVILYLVK